jgi:hypothetical protein
MVILVEIAGVVKPRGEGLGSELTKPKKQQHSVYSTNSRQLN